MTVCILSIILMGAQTATAASSANNSTANNSHPTHINLYANYWYYPLSYFDSEQNGIMVEISAHLIDETTRKKLSGRHIKFELISPEYGISEVQHDTTSSWFFGRVALANFEGPFTSGVWKVRASYGGNSKDHLAPCVAYIDLKKA